MPHSHIKKMRHKKRMPMEFAIEISTLENSFPKISCKVENQKHLWWILFSHWDRSWWYHILTNLLSMILHRSIYFSADTALGLSMESYPCENKNTKCAVYLTISWSAGHFRVPKTSTFKMRPNAQLFLWKWVLFASESGCKENHFHSLSFGQAEASIY